MQEHVEGAWRVGALFTDCLRGEVTKPAAGVSFFLGCSLLASIQLWVRAIYFFFFRQIRAAAPCPVALKCCGGPGFGKLFKFTLFGGYGVMTMGF